tara:strand:- start:60 stop:335 length:276 start_codon:yes stop_codon:yes gene_type:complete
MATTKIDAILAINPNAAINVTKDADGAMVIDWLDTTPISNSDIDTKVAELNTAETNKTNADASSKASGNTKLLNLGLTQAEATSLTGFTPE